MEYTKLKEINKYKSESINPAKTPDVVFEMYSVPIYDTGHPEYLRGDEIASNKAIVRKNDILLCKINPRINRVWIVADESEYTNIASSEWIVVRTEDYNPEFLAWYFRTTKFQKLMTSEVTGIGGSLTRAQPKCVAEYPVPILSRDQQDSIVEVLNQCKFIIEARKKELTDLDDLIKARFVELFDLNSCKRKTLGECTDFVDYRGHTPELSDEGTIRMVNAKSVGKGFFKYIDEYVTEETYDSWMHRGFAYPGDVLFVTEGHTFGNTCLIPDDMKKFALGQRVITIKGHGDIRNAFLCSYMQTDMFWKDINVYRTGGTAQGIRSKDLVKVEVPIPPLDKQDLFMNFVKQVDKSKVAVQMSLDETQKLFNSLMQDYFE